MVLIMWIKLLLKKMLQKEVANESESYNVNRSINSLFNRIMTHNFPKIMNGNYFITEIQILQSGKTIDQNLSMINHENIKKTIK